MRCHSSATYELLGLYVIRQGPAGSLFGYRNVVAVDDSNGDGIDDFVVGAPSIYSTAVSGAMYRFCVAAPTALPDPSAIDFGRKKLDRPASAPQSATLVSDSSNAATIVTEVTFSGPDAEAFSTQVIEYPYYPDWETAATVGFRFRPTRSGQHNATAAIFTRAAQTTPLLVSLTGEGDSAAVGNSVVWAAGSQEVNNVRYYGLYRLNANTQSASIRFYGAPSTLPINYVRGIVATGDNTVVVASNQFNNTVFRTFYFGSLIEVNTTSGARRDISAAGSGPVLGYVSGLKVGPDGALYVGSASLVNGGEATICRVDLATGNRTTVSSDSVGSGPSLGTAEKGAAYDLLFEESGTLLAATPNGLLRVDTTTGARTLIGSASAPKIAGMCQADPGAIAATHPAARSVVLVSTIDGTTTLVSGPGLGDGPELIAPSAIARDTDGNYLVLDARNHGIFRVYASTGDRELLSEGLGDPETPEPDGLYFFPKPNSDEEYALHSSLMFLQPQTPPSAASGAWTEYE